MSDALKLKVAKAAIALVEDNSVIGVGTGSTINFFIEQLATIKSHIEGCISSSDETTRRLKAKGIPIVDLNHVPYLPYYFDGADEANTERQLIKGGGGALTREKIIASVADQFICLIDKTKMVEQLGTFPIAVEVIPQARSYVGRELVKLGGDPEYRTGFVTDNGNIILDVYNLDLDDPLRIECALKAITGVVENGVFARRTADKILIAEDNGIQQL